MLRSLSVPVVALAVGATLSSSPAAACSGFGDDTYGFVSFQGQTVPKNAELWITAVDEVLNPDSELHLIGPDGVDVVVELERDLDGARVLTPAPLTAGSWIFRTRDVYEGETYDNDYEFAVSDVDDTEAPAPPVVTIVPRDIGGYGPLAPFFDPCGPSERESVRQVTIEAGSDVVRALVDGVHFNVFGGTLFLQREEDGSDITVTVFDYAGNASDVVVASPPDDAGGCGCTSNDAPSFVIGLAALACVRRRRRSGR